MTEKKEVRRRRRIRWQTIKLLLLLALAALNVYQLLYNEHLENQKANLQYQLICNQQDLRESEKQLLELKKIQEQNVSRGSTRSIVKLTDDEFNLVCRVVAAESRGQSVKGQRIVAQCIYDRLTSNCYGKDVTAVVTAPGQFAEPFQGDLDDFPAVTYAVYSVFFEGLMPLDADVRVFFNPETADPDAIAPLRNKYQYITTEGNHEIRGYV